MWDDNHLECVFHRQCIHQVISHLKVKIPEPHRAQHGTVIQSHQVLVECQPVKFVDAPATFHAFSFTTQSDHAGTTARRPAYCSAKSGRVQTTQEASRALASGSQRVGWVPIWPRQKSISGCFDAAAKVTRFQQSCTLAALLKTERPVTSHSL